MKKFLAIYLLITTGTLFVIADGFGSWGGGKLSFSEIQTWLSGGTVTTIVADSILVDTNTLVVAKTANRVGVGTATPASKFEVVFEDDLLNAGAKFGNSDGYMTFSNSTGDVNAFNAQVYMKPSAGKLGFVAVDGVDASVDDPVPFLIFRAQQGSGAVANASQYLFGFRNWGTNLFRVRADGAVVFDGATGKAAATTSSPVSGMIQFLNKVSGDADTIAVHNGTAWKYFISQ